MISSSQYLFRLTNNGVEGYLNSELDFVPDGEIAQCGMFHSGLAVARKNGRYGYINMRGKPICAFEYDYCEDFYGYYSIVCKHNEYGLLHVNGNLLTKKLWRSLVYSPWLDGCVRATAKDGAIGWITAEGENVIVPFRRTTVIGDFDEWHWAFVEENESRYFVDMNWRIVCRPKYKIVDPFGGDLCIVTDENGRYTFCTRIGTPAMDRWFSNAKPFREGVFVVESDGKWGGVDREGHTIVPFIYDSMEPFENGLSLVVRNGLWGMVSLGGHEFVPCMFSSDPFFVNGIVFAFESSGLVAFRPPDFKHPILEVPK